jgi:hypothetical protein
MVNLFRKYQQPLMIVVTVLIIISFVWLYNGTQMDKLGTDRVGVIYGRGISQAEFLRNARRFEVARALELFDLFGTLVGRATSLDEARENFVWNSLVLRHEANQLSIGVTDDDVIAAVQQLPKFQTSGVYDSSKYNEFVQTVLLPNGFSPDQLEELVRDQLRLERIKKLIGSTVQPAPAEVRAAYELRSRKTEVSFVKLNREEFLQAAQVGDEDLKKLFEERKETLKTDEKRKVRFAAFTLDEAGKALTGKERIEAMQKLADRAQDFAVAMAEPNAKFDEAATKAQITPAETAEFTQQEPPPELGGSREISRAAFALTEQEPNSDALAAAEGYYVMQLSGITPARPLTFEEAQPKLAQQLKEERASEAMNLRAAELRNKIQPELQAGKSFADAAAAAGAKAETFPPFSLAQPNLQSPDAREIITTSMELPEGQMSDFVPTAEGGLLVHVDKRHPAEEEQFTKEQQTLAESLGGAKREAAFQDWLNERRAAANVVTGQS